LAANGIITNETTIAEDPNVIRRFIGAVLRGLEYTIENPEEAYEISMNFVEGLEEGDAIQMEVLTLSIDFWRADTLGHSDRSAWENMQEVLLDMGLLTEPLDLDEAFTNEYID
jgi:NitT/TauT family transport system substrate-binding protein